MAMPVNCETNASAREKLLLPSKWFVECYVAFSIGEGNGETQATTCRHFGIDKLELSRCIFCLFASR